jgi:signal transduction histidine kinase
MAVGSHRDERRRSVLLKNTFFATFGYSIPAAAFWVIRWLDLASYSYTCLIILYLWILLSRLASYFIIRFKREITTHFANLVMVFELVNWVLIFCYLIYYLNEMRILALFCAFMGLIFLLTNSGFVPSLMLSLTASVSYTAISYYQIEFGRQKGSFVFEFLCVVFFMFSSIFVAMAASLFKRQRQEVIEAKRKAESMIAELEDARKEAETASRAKTAFLANMSHELRTPLNHIIGFTELIVDKNFGEINAVQQEYLTDMLGSSRHLLALINDILDLSKVEAGKLEFDLVEINPKELLEGSLMMIKEKTLKHQIRIVKHFESIPEVVVGDERSLKQIMYNLLSNAVKFTPDGGSITLSARLLSFADGHFNDQNGKEVGLPFEEGEGPVAESAFLEISLKDSGVGIKAEDLERIFQPFEQGDSSAGRRYPGTGLGLSLCRKLVELHGGRIWAESEGQEKGSTFRFIIPQHPGEA